MEARSRRWPGPAHPRPVLTARPVRPTRPGEMAGRARTAPPATPGRGHSRVSLRGVACFAACDRRAGLTPPWPRARPWAREPAGAFAPAPARRRPGRRHRHRSDAPLLPGAWPRRRPVRGGPGGPVARRHRHHREADVLAAGERPDPADQVAVYPAWETLPHERLSPRATRSVAGSGARGWAHSRAARPRRSGRAERPDRCGSSSAVRSVLQPQLRGWATWSGGLRTAAPPTSTPWSNGCPTSLTPGPTGHQARASSRSVVASWTSPAPMSTPGVEFWGDR